MNKVVKIYISEGYVSNIHEMHALLREALYQEQLAADFAYFATSPRHTEWREMNQELYRECVARVNALRRKAWDVLDYIDDMNCRRDLYTRARKHVED